MPVTKGWADTVRVLRNLADHVAKAGEPGTPAKRATTPRINGEPVCPKCQQRARHYTGHPARPYQPYCLTCSAARTKEVRRRQREHEARRRTPC